MPRKTRMAIEEQVALLGAKEEINYDDPPDDDDFSMDPEYLRSQLASSKESVARSRHSKEQTYSEQQAQYWHLSDMEIVEGITMLVNASFRDWIQHPLHSDDVMPEEKVEAPKGPPAADSPKKGKKSGSSSEEEGYVPDPTSSVELDLGGSSEDGYGSYTEGEGFTTEGEGSMLPF